MHKKINYLKYCAFVILILFFSTIVIIISVFILHPAFRTDFPGLSNQNTVGLIAFLFLSLLVSIALSYILVQQVLKPLMLFINGTQRISEGDFEVRLPINSSVDEIKKLSTNFNTMASQLNRVSTLRNDFIASVSHEFKTPLSVIEGYATLLQDKTISNDLHNQYVIQIIKSTQQLSSMTGNLLELSKLNNFDQNDFDQTVFSVDEQIRTAILWLTPKWQAKNITLNIELPKAFIEGNQPLLMDVWVNLIDNAIKFSNKNSSIEVALIKCKDGILFKITNHGTIIDSDSQMYVFDQFYQSEKSHNEVGNGLGLSIVKKIVQLHNGEIKLLQSNEKGTVFQVSITRRTSQTGTN